MNTPTIPIESGITAPFESMNARIRTRPMQARTGWQPLEQMRPFVFDIARDRRGQYFDLELNPSRVTRLLALDVRPKARHLLLLLSEREETEKGIVQTDHRLLCGHDEREWFLAALPGERRVTTVVQAMEALKPNIVRNSQRRRRVKSKDRNRRRNAGFVRQGEWFFLPEPSFRPQGKYRHHNEPLRRGEGKPHIAEWLVRVGGRTGYMSARNNGRVLTQAEYREWVLGPGQGRPDEWIVATIDPTAYVRGTVRHPDHKTIELATWHRVVPNTEPASGRATNLAFVD